MAETEPHDPHAATDGHEDHDAHEGEELGPIDVLAWAFGAVGIALGLVVAAAFVAAAT